jgi:hypothetical protein
MTLPVAHIGHYLWVFYLLPVIFVIAGIVKTTLSEKKASRAESAGEKDDESSVPQTQLENPGEKGDPPAGGTRGDAENENLARRRPPL